MKKFKKAISLIVLVISIIVMVMLATTMVISITNSGVLNKSNDAVFRSTMTSYLEQLNTYYADQLLSNFLFKKSNVNLVNNEMLTAIPQMDSVYLEKLSVVNGYLTYLPDVTSAEDLEKARVACTLGLKVAGSNTCDDIPEVVLTPLSTYAKNGNSWYYSPDLTGFNTNITYYVVYNEETGAEDESLNIANKSPNGWFDYDSKKWANIVVKDGNVITYFTWIPRYAYKIDATNSVIDVKFITTDNDYRYTDALEQTVTGQGVVASSATIDAETQLPTYSDYIVHPAFTVDMSDEEGKGNVELKGFWMTKYELSETGVSDFTTTVTGNKINVTGVTTVSTCATYDFVINGELKATQSGKTYTYTGLQAGTTYNIKVIGRDASGTNMGAVAQDITTTSAITDSITDVTADAVGDKIIVSKVTLTSAANARSGKAFDMYINGIFKMRSDDNEDGAGEITGLFPNTSYQLKVVFTEENGVYIGERTVELTTGSKPTYNEPNIPALDGFNLNNTYYVIYNEETGAEDTTRLISNPLSSAELNTWYNYSEKKWANIVVKDGNVSTYLVWIPRYEYKILEATQTIDIAFISESKHTATSGYNIPVSFILDMGDEEGYNPGDVKHLSGFWMTKYELSEVVEQTP